MLHAEKLANDEQPISLVDLERLRDELLPAEQWNAPIVDRMGEHWLRSLIGTASKRPGIARTAAAGWGSDQMALWRSTDGEAEVVTWQFVFDDPQEHREGLSGMRRWFFSHTANEAEAVFANMLSWDGPAGAARLVTRPRAGWLVSATRLRRGGYRHPPARRLVGRLERPRDCRRCRQRHPHPYLDQLLGGAVAVRDPESKRGDWSFPHECAVVGRR